MQATRRARGFSLIELLIVVAIILIIASIAIPNLLRARISANEASAVQSVRAINQAEISYSTTYPGSGYAATLSALGGAVPCTPSPTSGCLLDNTLANGVKSGYNFAAVGANPVNGANTSYVAGGAPTAYNQTGVRLFCSIEDGVVRWDANGAKSTTPPNAAACASYAALQ